MQVPQCLKARAPLAAPARHTASASGDGLIFRKLRALGGSWCGLERSAVIKIFAPRTC
jgi:hypothetical protein